jgi:hypothetical protein
MIGPIALVVQRYTGSFTVGSSLILEKSMEKGTGTYKQYPYWARGPAWVEDGYVVLDEARATPYYIFEPPNLLFDLLNVYRPTGLEASDVTGFVRRYGLLHHGEGELGSGQCRESLDKWHEELADLDTTARLYIDLAESARNGLTESMRERFAHIPTPSDEPHPEDEEFLGAASIVLAEWITEGMQDTKAGLASTVWLDTQPQGPTTFLLSQLPPNLVAAAYSQFAFLIANKAPLATCPGCGRLFHPKSGKQKYCTSSCASTSRWRRWNDRQVN